MSNTCCVELPSGKHKFLTSVGQILRLGLRKQQLIGFKVSRNTAGGKMYYSLELMMNN